MAQFQTQSYIKTTFFLGSGLRIHTHVANHKPSPDTRNYEIHFTEKSAGSGSTQKLVLSASETVIIEVK